MARTINEIANEIKVDFVQSPTMRTAFSITGYSSEMDDIDILGVYNDNFPAVGVITVLIFIVATCAAAVENMFDWFTEDISNMIDSERYGHKGWYENTAKAFQYQDGNGVDYVLNTNTGSYDTIDEDSMIITNASCINGSGFGITLKVAKGESGSLTPLSINELTAFTSYIKRLKPAGIPVSIISSEADQLALGLTCYYDPLIFNSTTALAKIKEICTAYMQGIEFNGEFVTMTMIDKLQAVSGLDIIEVHNVSAKRAGYDYVAIENDARYVPKSGYMVLGDDSVQQIELIANV